MKVSVLCFDLSSNAFGRAVLLAQALSGFCDVEIVGPSRKGDIWFPLRQTSFPVKSFEWKRYPFFVPVAQHILREIDGDVILASKLMPTSSGIGLLKKWASDKPLILDVDDWELGFFYHSGFWGRVGRFLNLSNPNGLPYAWLMERLTGYADAVTVSNRFLQNKFGGTLLPHCRDTSILDPERFDSETIKEAWGLKGKKVLMFLGTPRPHKGIDDLRMALEKIGDPDAYLLIVGAEDPAMFSGEEWTAVQERVRVFPKISFEKFPEYLAAADILLVPQRQSTDSIGQMPAKLYDAMAMGKPIVATRVSDIEEVLGDCGYLVDPGEPAQLSDAIQYILDHPEEAQRRGREARERCKRLYDITVMEVRLRELIDTVVSGQGGAV
ncbi:MAG: glycosyltransferase family 4 protein [Desulfobacterales bacterium]|nr:glycosyltransferase family 4 protein [Desulfobacterales bacterium]